MGVEVSPLLLAWPPILLQQLPSNPDPCDCEAATSVRATGGFSPSFDSCSFLQLQPSSDILLSEDALFAVSYLPVTRVNCCCLVRFVASQDSQWQWQPPPP